MSEINYNYKDRLGELFKKLPNKNGAKVNQWLHNKRVNKLLNTDYFEDCYRDVNGLMFYKNTPLYSISRVLRAVNEVKLANVPIAELEYAKDMGKRFMGYLQYWRENNIRRVEEIPFTTPEDRVMFMDFMKLFKESGIKVYDIEKFFKSGDWCGYFDGIISVNGWKVILEIKTRNNLKVRDTDLIQANFYYNITNIPVLLCIYDKKTRQFHFERISYRNKLNKKYQLPFDKFNEVIGYFGYKKIEKLNLGEGNE